MLQLLTVCFQFFLNINITFGDASVKAPLGFTYVGESAFPRVTELTLLHRHKIVLSISLERKQKQYQQDRRGLPYLSRCFRTSSYEARQFSHTIDLKQRRPA